MSTKYQPGWQLESIPFEAIPHELLKSWWSQYTNSKQKKKDVDPEQRRRLDEHNRRNREWRARQKAQQSTT